MSQNYDYDVLIIGSGPGGYVAAIRAAQLGLRAAVAEKGSLGGVCLNIGCIPSKAIIHSADIFRNRSKLTAMGVAVDDTGFRYENVFNESRRAAETLSRGVAYLLKKNGVAVIAGAARLVSGHEAAVADGDGGESRVSAGAVIIATGSRPKELPGLEFDGERVLSSDGALMLKELPKRAIIAGGGAVGVEFAHILNAFGSEAHIVEAAERLLPAMDGEITAVLTRSFVKRGIKIHTSSRITSHKISGGAMDAVIESAGGGRTGVAADKIFVMTGRSPNSEGIGLEELGVAVRGGFIAVGDYYQTNVPSVYAVGDVAVSPAPAPLLAHAASAAGEIAAEHIAGRVPRTACVDPLAVPAAVYCEPQIASFGLTEEQASARGVSFDKASFPYRGCGKAVATDMAEGMVKVLADRESKRIIGAHIIGAGASELIHELLLASGAEEVASMIHAHPTLSETVMEAVRGLIGRAIHI